MAVTLKDVAQLAGVSTSTVSRTCKDHPSISEETKEKAIEYAQKLYPLDKKAAEYVAFMKGFKYGRENGKKNKRT